MTYEVDMHVAKACIASVKCPDRRFVVAVHLGIFSWNAAPWPFSAAVLQAFLNSVRFNSLVLFFGCQLLVINSRGVLEVVHFNSYQGVVCTSNGPKFKEIQLPDFTLHVAAWLWGDGESQGFVVSDDVQAPTIIILKQTFHTTSECRQKYNISWLMAAEILRRKRECCLCYPLVLLAILGRRRHD